MPIDFGWVPDFNDYNSSNCSRGGDRYVCVINRELSKYGQFVIHQHKYIGGEFGRYELIHVFLYSEAGYTVAGIANNKEKHMYASLPSHSTAGWKAGCTLAQAIHYIESDIERLLDSENACLTTSATG